MYAVKMSKVKDEENLTKNSERLKLVQHTIKIAFEICKSNIHRAFYMGLSKNRRLKGQMREREGEREREREREREIERYLSCLTRRQDRYSQIQNKKFEPIHVLLLVFLFYHHVENC